MIGLVLLYEAGSIFDIIHKENSIVRVSLCEQGKKYQAVN